jgi:hypothetical protein
MSSVPSSLSVVYATDEDILKIAGADFRVIAGKAFQLAYGTDGQILAASPWVLTSASVNFQNQGILGNQVFQLSLPAAPASSPLGGTGGLFAVDSVAGNAVTLRRAGYASGIGQPPITANTTGITFLCASLWNLIEDVSFNLNEAFAADPNISLRTPADMYNQRIFKDMVVFGVLEQAYANLNRTTSGDFKDKVEFYGRKFAERRANAVLRWGPMGNTQPPTGPFSCRITR